MVKRPQQWQHNYPHPLAAPQESFGSTSSSSKFWLLGYGVVNTFLPKHSLDVLGLKIHARPSSIWLTSFNLLDVPIAWIKQKE
jgi:hypothetical protein